MTKLKDVDPNTPTGRRVIADLKGKLDTNDRNDEERIKKILKAPERISEKRNNNTTIEKSIIERLKK